MLSPGSCSPEQGSLLLIDRPGRLQHIFQYFKEWHDEVQRLPYTKKVKERMFVSHQLYQDIRRTCLGTVELINKHVPHTTNELVLRRLNQDPIESRIFGQLRNLSGSNRNMTREDVDHGFAQIRSLCEEQT